MKRVNLSCLGLLLIIAGILFFVSDEAEAVGALIPVSSATYNGSTDGDDSACDVAIDNSGNIIVTGMSSTASEFNFFTIKYNSDLSAILSSTGTVAAGIAMGVSVDNSDNIFITGISTSGATYDFLTIKYNNNLVLQSSATHNGDGNAYDGAMGMTIDSVGNIIVTGQSQGFSGYEFLTLQYDSNLSAVLSSAAYTISGSHNANAVAVDNSGNIIVTGFRGIGAGDWDWLTIKYDQNLIALSSVTYDSGSGNDDKAEEVAIDDSDNIIVTGFSSNGSNDDYYTIKYNSDLSQVVSSARYNGPANGNDYAGNVVVDGAGNIIVSGISSNGTTYDYVTIKYSSDLSTIISSDTYSAGVANPSLFRMGMALDNSGNIVIAGHSNNGSNTDFFTLIYNNASPAVFSLSPAYGRQEETLDITISGSNFYEGATVVFSGIGITVNSVTVNSTTQMTANITVANDAALGIRDVTVTNIDEQSGIKTQSFEVKVYTSDEEQVEIDSDQDNTVTLNAEAGDVVVEVPANTFSSDATMTVSVSEVPVSDRPALKKTDIGIDISVSSGEQLLKDIAVKVYYRDSDIAGLDEEKLVLCRYDAVNTRWIVLPTVVYADNNYLIATIDHLSKFGVLQLAAASDLDTAKVYPNPYNPLTDGSLIFDNLTNETTIKIYTVGGSLVRELKETDGNGRLEWDGTNDTGETLASGVYIAFIKGNSDEKILKIAVVK